MIIEKSFNACTQHLGELPIFALYDVSYELAQFLPSQTLQLILQVFIRQVHVFPVCHGNNI